MDERKVREALEYCAIAKMYKPEEYKKAMLLVNAALASESPAPARGGWDCYAQKDKDWIMVMSDKQQPTPEQTDASAVPDLYRLAYMPGCWKCEKCGFILTKQTMNFALGIIGTAPENRQSEQCPNDGEWMKPVTYREQLEVYAERLTEVFNERDKLTAEFARVREEMKEQCAKGEDKNV